MCRLNSHLWKAPASVITGLGVLRYIFLPVLVLTFLFSFSQNLLTQQWTQQHSSTTANLRGVWFVDSAKGWVCGDSGIILHTTDAGQRWLRQNSGVTSTLEDLFFWDEMQGWVVGDSATILHTTDGGVNWLQRTSNVSSRLTHVSFTSIGRGYATGARATVLWSTDWGFSWSGSMGDTTAPDLDAGLILGEWFAGRSIYGSAEVMAGSPIWCVPLNTNPDRRFYDVVGTLENGRVDIWFVGHTWPVNIVVRVRATHCFDLQVYLQFTNDTVGLNSICRSPNSGRLWAVGGQGKFVSSIDSGSNWQRIVAPSSVEFRSNHSPVEQICWIVGDSGIILLYRDSPVGVAYITSPPVHLWTALPYPNPFNSSTRIEFSLSYQTYLTVAVYNSLGQSLRTLHEGMTSAGNHLVWFNTEGLSTGLYFVSFKTPLEQKSVKAIVIK